MNVITLSGNVGKVNELKHTKQKGTAVLTFSVAVDKNYGDETYWFKVQVWGTTAENMDKLLPKAKAVVFTGEMQLPYDKQKKVYYPQVNAQKVDILAWKDTQSEPDINPEDFNSVEDDDDIPF